MVMMMIRRAETGLVPAIAALLLLVADGLKAQLAFRGMDEYDVTREDAEMGWVLD